MTRRILTLITWAGALLWTFGVAIISPTVMAVGGIIAGLALIGWGLVVALQDGTDAELPFQPIKQGEFMFDHETDEWRRCVATMSEFEREVAEDSRRAALGLAGNREDER